MIYKRGVCTWHIEQDLFDAVHKYLEITPDMQTWTVCYIGFVIYKCDVCTWHIELD